MDQTERVMVGQSLDLLRDALLDYVDAAMKEAYGLNWDERVANEDAKRRPNNRKQPVSKSDLAVMLKVIQHERIAPWGKSTTYVDPRIRSFATEILTLRNLFSHGNECINEHVRLLDTASRFLQLLALQVPAGLETPDRTSMGPAHDGAVDVHEESSLARDLFNEEISRLGEPVRRLAEIFNRTSELELVLDKTLDADESNEQQTEAEILQNKLLNVIVTTGAEVFDLLGETYRLKSDGQNDSPVQKVLIQLVLCKLLNSSLLQSALLGYLASSGGSTGADLPEPVQELKLLLGLDPDKLHTDQGRLSLLETWGSRRNEPSRELIRLAQHLPEGSPIAHTVIIIGSLQLLSNPALDSDEEIQLLRDSSASARILATMRPGTEYESLVVVFLRHEGRVCNDLERWEEATRAFARADEIIDRYPVADPDLVL